MEIFLLILKILGIVLLAILGLVLFIVLVVLITPIRYRIQGSYKENKPDVLVTVGIWFKLILFDLSYREDGLSAKLKIFFFKKNIITPGKKEELAEDTLEGYETLDTSELDEGPANADAGEDNVGVTQETEQSETVDTEPEEKPTEDTQEKPEEIHEDTTEEEPESTQEQTSEEVIEEEYDNIVDKIVAKLRNPYEKIAELYNKILKKKNALLWLWEQEPTKRLLFKAKKQLIKVLKSVLPRKFKGYLTLGLEDPSTMGMICSYVAALYPGIEKSFTFTPVFDEKVIDGEGDISGRILLGALLIHLLGIVFTRDFFRTLKNLKRFKKRWR